MMTFQEITASDKSYRKGVHVPLVHIDMAGDLNAGILLSQIKYWYERRQGDFVVKKRSEWHDEIRLSEKQYDRAINILKTLGLVTVQLKKSIYHNGATVPHITINERVFAELHNEKIQYFMESELTEEENASTVLPKGQSPFYPKGETRFTQRSKPSITENISENISENIYVTITGKFKKPTVDEIKTYCDERENKVDPQHFYDFYESKGWLVGKNKMKDWKACVRTWERNNFEKSGGFNKQLPVHSRKTFLDLED